MTTPPKVTPPMSKYGSGASFAFRVRILSGVIGARALRAWLS